MRPRMRLRLVVLAVLSATTAACAARAHDIAHLKSDPRFVDRRVTVRGVVTTSWGVPLVPFRFYKIDDGSGELTVLSRESRAPSRGARVRVTGRLSELAVLGGRPLGLHLEEDDLDYLRR